MQQKSVFSTEDSGSSPSRWLHFGARLALSAACLICAAIIAVDSLYLTIRYFQPVFEMDPWQTVNDYKSFKAGTYTLSDLFSQHNEHRIAVPRLVFWADFALGRGLNMINVATIFLIQAMHAALLTLMASRALRGLVLVIDASAVVVLLFSFGQSDNLTFGFQVQFVGVYAAATLAFFLFASAIETDATPTRRSLFIAGALCSAIIATYMMSNGVFSPAILLFLSIAARAERRIVAFVGAFTAAILLAYLHHAQFDATPANAHFDPSRIFAIAAYLLIYVGGILGGFGLTAAGVFGAIGCLLAAVGALRLILRRDRDPERTALIGVMAFVIATAAVTAWGRVSFGLPQALESRYVTPSAVFWAAQVVYWSASAQQTSRRWSFGVFAALIATVMIGAVQRHIAQRPTARWNFMDANLVTDALLTDVFPTEIMRFLDPDASKIRTSVSFLDSQRLNIFALKAAGWRGKSVRHLFEKVDEQDCVGAIDKRSRIGEGGDEALEGWAWNKARRRAADRIVVAGADGTIVGFGSGSWFRPDFRSLPAVENAEPGWKGFARHSAGEPLFAYGIFGEEACELKLP